MTFNKSWSLSGVIQTLFSDQALIQLLSVSYSGPEFGCSVVLATEIFVPDWQQRVDILWHFYRPNSYGNPIGFLNMSWSTLCAGNNEASLIKFGVHLDLRS